MPILSNHGVRECCKGLKADYFMTRDPVVFRATETLQNIAKVFKNTDHEDHHAFPIVNDKGVLVGIIPRNHIINILKQKNFYYPEEEKYDEPEYKNLRSPEQQEIMNKYREQNKLDAAATNKQWAHKSNSDESNIKILTKELK